MLRFGLIGCGTHARWAVLPALAESAQCRLCAVADIVPANLADIEAQDIACYTDYRAMLAAEALDAVYVATPVEAHCAPTIAALEAGCHVHCEKPMAVGIDECRRMIDAATAAGKHLSIGFENRYLASFQQVRRWIADGKIGTVCAVHLNHMWDGHKLEGWIGERRRRFMQSSGCLDCGIHTLDIARYYCGGGEWQQIHALGAWCGEDTNYPPHIAILARLSPDIVVTVNASFAYTAYIKAAAQYEGLVIIGTKGVIALDRDPQGQHEFILIGEDGEERFSHEDVGHGSAITLALNDLATAITHGTPLPPALATGYDGLMAQLITDAANEQAVANRNAAHV